MLTTYHTGQTNVLIWCFYFLLDSDKMGALRQAAKLPPALECTCADSIEIGLTYPGRHPVCCKIAGVIGAILPITTKTPIHYLIKKLNIHNLLKNSHFYFNNQCGLDFFIWGPHNVQSTDHRFHNFKCSFVHMWSFSTRFSRILLDSPPKPIKNTSYTYFFFFC